MMDFGIASVAAITVVCYLGGMACKASAKVKDEVIPVVCGVTGGILGVAGMPDTLKEKALHFPHNHKKEHQEEKLLSDALLLHSHRRYGS